MVEVAEDNKKKEKKGEKERKRKGDAKKGGEKVPIEPTTSYSTLPLNYAYVFNCTYYLSQISFLMM